MEDASKKKQVVETNAKPFLNSHQNIPVKAYLSSFPGHPFQWEWKKGKKGGWKKTSRRKEVPFEHEPETESIIAIIASFFPFLFFPLQCAHCRSQCLSNQSLRAHHPAFGPFFLWSLLYVCVCVSCFCCCYCYLFVFASIVFWLCMFCLLCLWIRTTDCWELIT